MCACVHAFGAFNPLIHTPTHVISRRTGTGLAEAENDSALEHVTSGNARAAPPGERKAVFCLRCSMAVFPAQGILTSAILLSNGGGPLPDVNLPHAGVERGLMWKTGIGGPETFPVTNSHPARKSQTVRGYGECYVQGASDLPIKRRFGFISTTSTCATETATNADSVS